MDLSNELFRTLVDQIQDYAIYLLAPDGTVMSWNAGAQRLKGYTSAEIIGQSFSCFFSERDRANGKPGRLLAEALRAGRIEDVGWRIRKDGSQFWASALITALHDEHGAHIGFAKVTRDLTERSYRAFVETTHALVWTTDPTGAPNADSPSWRELTGQSEDDWRAGRGWDALHPDDAAGFRAAWERARADGRPFVAQYRVRRADGAYVWVEARAIPFFDRDGHVQEWFAVALDVSERKGAELRTARALELWRTTLRSIGDAVIATDETGLVQFMNPVAVRLTGWIALEAAGQPLHVVFPIFNEETGEAVENPVEKVLRHGAIVGLANHTVLRRKDGQLIPIDDSAAPILDDRGQITGVVLVFRDASDEKLDVARRSYIAQATSELLAAADQREALARVAQLAVPRLADWVSVEIIDPATRRLELVALAHVDPTKAARAEEMARRHPADLDATTGVANVVRTGQSVLVEDISPAQIDAAAIDDEHGRFLREMSLRSGILVPLRGRGPVFGAITFLLAGPGHRRYDGRDLQLAEDLASRAGLVIERRRLEEEAAKANRMKDEFLAVVSHELRTPLQAILGYAALLESGGARDPTKAIAAILRSASAQARLVDDILDVSRISRGTLQLDMSVIDVNAPIRGALDTIRPTTAAKDVKLIEHLDDDLPFVYGDRERLQQVVWNLLSNAVKFTPSGGRVEIAARRDGPWLEIEVTDTGVGIAPEHLDLVFERFRQVDSSSKRAHGGLGLGLSIVQHLVDSHGGTVEARSEGLGRGASFLVKLPARARPRDAPSGPIARVGEPEPSRLRGLRVLVVEDDDDSRSLMEDCLATAGATTVVATSVAEALALVHAQPPHVLISDIGMPQEDGIALIRRIRSMPVEKGGDVPSIAVTAYADAESRHAAEEAGFQVYLTKPVSREALIAAVQSFTRRR